MGIILSVLRLEVSAYNVYITSRAQTTFAHGGGGRIKSVSKGDFDMEEISQLLRPRIRPL
jgi:hypothetical protein